MNLGKVFRAGSRLMKIIVTGTAGFVGFHLAERLLERGDTVIGIDIVNDYYEVTLKAARQERLSQYDGYRFYRADVSDMALMSALFAEHSDADSVVHLAAQAGVRYSIENPQAYITANVLGQLAILEAMRSLARPVTLLYASSSSVYGANRDIPFSPEQKVTSPVSLYAATKLAAEHMAECYGHLYDIASMGFRFFTVYGPYGRPDMAYYKFAKAIAAGEPITVYNNGEMARDFTYVSDVIDGLVAAIGKTPERNEYGVRHKVYNLGNHRPTNLLHFIHIIEREMGRTTDKHFAPMQKGDVLRTFADIEDSRRDLGYEPRVPVEEGLARFVSWFKTYHGIN
jgi:UDP-glucuronate 4-epimerase